MLEAIQAISKGIAYGLMLAIIIGPVFFALLQVSLTFGVRHGLWMASGIALSDICCIILTYFGAATAAHNPVVIQILGYSGSIILLVAGLKTFFKKGVAPTNNAEPILENRKSFFKLALKGFILNAVNPFTLFFWLGTSGMVIEEQYSITGDFLFFATTMLTVFCTDIVKANLARLLRNFLTEVRLTWLNRVAGTGLIIFGLRMLWLVILKPFMAGKFAF